MEPDQNTSLFGLSIDQTSKVHLNEVARWARFLALVGFIVCGLIIVFGFFASSVLRMMMNRVYGSELNGIDFEKHGSILSFVYIGFALVYFFPCLFLFRFANKMNAALLTNDQGTLNKSFQNLKIMFRYVGILTIIVLSLYALTILLLIAGSAMV